MRIKIEYFALFRERAGKKNEEIDTHAKTAGELYEQIKQLYTFTLPLSQVKIAINDRFVDTGSVLTQGDRVVFIAPIAGG